MNERTLDVYLAEPRGFCTGVRRAVGIVEEALKQYGAPVFVRHEIVHNKFVIENLRAKGAVFIDELAEVPDGRPVGTRGRTERLRRSRTPRPDGS